jgi:hypothetical protein
MYFSGPHLGVVSDNRLFKLYTPPLAPGETLLGDKAYCDRALEHQIVAPIKARHHRSLLDVQQEYNDLHAWYRASIEHLFGYLKRFRIIGNDVSFIIVIHHDV